MNIPLLCTCHHGQVTSLEGDRSVYSRCLAEGCDDGVLICRAPLCDDAAVEMTPDGPACAWHVNACWTHGVELVTFGGSVMCPVCEMDRFPELRAAGKAA